MRLLDPFSEWCGACGKPGIWLCLSCSKKVDLYSPQRCIYCHQPSPFGLTHTGCLFHTYVDGAISIYYYRGALLRILKKAKFKGLKNLMSQLFFSIQPQNLFSLWDVRRFFSPQYITYIPMIKTDERVRGYNQSQTLARYVSSLMHIPLSTALIKKKKIEHQSVVALNKRRVNIKNVFSVLQKIPPTHSRILLIDDVITTGSTVNEAARVLKKNGCNKVFVWSLFRAR